MRSFFGEGKGSQQELELEHLSSILELLDDRFGNDLTDVDKRADGRALPLGRNGVAGYATRNDRRVKHSALAATANSTDH